MADAQAGGAAPGTLLFLLAKREQKQRVFGPLEAVMFAAIVIAACADVYALAIGDISDRGETRRRTCRVWQRSPG